MIANQETLAALVQFFNTAYTSGESGASFGEVPAALEESSTDFYLPQPDVSSSTQWFFRLFPVPPSLIVIVLAFRISCPR